MGVQVDLLTQGKSCHEKEFIDFEFDGKHVSEFGLVAVFDGGRHSFATSPEFEDETSEVNGVSGQYYWGTRFKTFSRSFSLATDGMTDAQINAFKLHFKPGKYGRFIEDKAACRYNYCRVSAAPAFSVVPFLIKKKIKIGNVEKTIEINEYKGSATITFIFDDPHLYATRMKIPSGQINDDSLREMLLNNVPIEGYSWPSDNGAMFLGDDILNNTNDSANKNQRSIKFYNPSTVPAKTKMSLTFSPMFTSNRPSGENLVYFSEIADTVNSTNRQCNSIVEKNADGKIISEFAYTSPNIVYQTNRAIQVALNYYTHNRAIGWTVLGLEEALRLEITNPKVIGWATAILRMMKTPTSGFYNSENDTFNTSTKTINLTMLGTTQGTVNWLGYFNVYMLCIMATQSKPLVGTIRDTLLETEWTMKPYTVHFNGENSEATIEYQYNYVTTDIEKSQVVEEKCGDMICSPYLKLDGGDTLDETGLIVSNHTLEFFRDGQPSQMQEITLEYTYTYL